MALRKLLNALKDALGVLPGPTGEPSQDSSSEASKVYEAVEKKKQRAASLKIRELFDELYFHNIIFYPSWIQHSRAHVPAMVHSAAKVGKEEIHLEINSRKYVFRFVEKRFSTRYCQMLWVSRRSLVP